MEFFGRLTAACRKRNSLLCVGLDPRPARRGSADELVELNKRVIGETAELAACYKPNIAFYEAYGPSGIEALQKTISFIPDGTPIIIDAKRGDIGSTAEAYAEALFTVLGADAVTINPYMGKSSADPFLAYEERGVFVLCRTSNPGAGRIQELAVVGADGTSEELYVTIAREAAGWGPQVGLVVAGNDGEALAVIRRELPDCWILAPGIGAQGGAAEEAVTRGVRADGYGVLPVVVRAIANASEPGRAARMYRDAINEAREKAANAAVRGNNTVETSARAAASGGGGTAKTTAHGAASGGAGESVERTRILDGLIETGCFKLGEFLLKSGVTSPFYIDLRIASSHPPLLKSIARAYATLLRSVRGDRVAGIPVAALPFATALSLETGIPLIYPRMSAKDHGTGRTIEGSYAQGERAILVDDLITTGKSKIEAAEILREGGLVVSDLAVLIERGSSGRRDMERAGITLHAYFTIDELFARCRELGRIDAEQEAALTRFASEST